MVKVIFSFVILVLLFGCSSEFSKLVKQGDQEFKQGNYIGAQDKYQKALELDTSKIAVYYKYAEASRLSYDSRSAEKSYDIVYTKDKKEKFKKSLYYLALMKKLNGKYAQGNDLFNEYQVKHEMKDGPGDYHIQKSDVEMNACINAKDYLRKNIDTVFVINTGNNINRPSFDYAPYQYGSNILYFSSIRLDSCVYNKSSESNAPLMYSKIYKSYLKDSVWSEAQELDESIFNIKDKHTGNTTFTSDLKRVYFTICEHVNASKSRCDIYFSDYNNGKWSKPAILNEKINLPKYNNTHPQISSNGSNGDILFFASDRPGGQGNMDIWYSEISPSGEYSDPVNVGPTINTLDDEISPYYEPITQTLYFSSEWHEGLGGFDIFKSSGYQETWSEPKNLGFPFNTSANDTYFSLNNDNESGYFVSNRDGAMNPNGAVHCSDIYSFKYVEPPKKKSAIDEVGIGENNALASEKAIRALIPVVLYFHNDEPDKKSEAKTTKLDYKDTYKEYIKMEEEYVNEYSKGTTDEMKKIELESDIQEFFSDYVRKGYNTLDLFMDLLLENLEKGGQVTITIKGYCSPLTTEQYNKNLANRRIQSLLNYFNSCKNGVFKQYLDGTAQSKGFLTFIEEPIGENDSPQGISDSYKDTKNSIYNPLAAIERKVIILSISMYMSNKSLDEKIKNARMQIKEQKDIILETMPKLDKKQILKDEYGDEEERFKKDEAKPAEKQEPVKVNMEIELEEEKN